MNIGKWTAATNAGVQMHPLRLAQTRSTTGMAKPRTLGGLQVELAPDLLDDRPEGCTALGVADPVDD